MTVDARVLPAQRRDVPVPRAPAAPRRMRDIVGFAVLTGLLFLPMLPVLVWSFSATWFYPDLIPTRFDLRSWEYILSPNARIIPAFTTSLVIASVVAVVAGLIGLSAGRALGLHSFRGKRLVYFLILAPEIVPPLTVAMGNQIAFIRFGLADTTLGVMLVQLVPTIPYVTLVMSAVYANYDLNYEAQARVLGASPLRTFIHVTLPAVFPGLVVAMLFAFLIAWSEYVMTLLIGGGVVRTLPLVLFSFATSDLSVASALSVLFVIPAVVILVVSSRFLSGDRATMGGFGKL
jgi:putative spermidine/putrescine transport system permease protein